MDNSIKLSKEWLQENVARFTHNGSPIDEQTVISLANEFTSTLSEKGLKEVGKIIKEFDIFHSDYGWIRCYCGVN